MIRDIRWIQRYNNYCKALEQLKKAVELSKTRNLSELEEQGLIQAFEFTHELAWNTLKDFLGQRGNQNIYGSKDAVREAFNYGILENGETWMEMIQSRNRSSHTYDEKIAKEIAAAVTEKFYQEFVFLQQKLSGLKDKDQNEE